ncbi:MAG: hypothetical protein ACYC6P_07350 [Ignavibacteriaceae bacterium]
MEKLQSGTSSNYLEKLLEMQKSSSGSLSSFDSNFLVTGAPVTLEQVIQSEIQKHLIPLRKTQDALIDQFAEVSLDAEAIKREMNNITSNYSENYQLKRNIKNINSIISFKKLDSNWNGNNAEPFSDTIIERALDIINSPSLKFQPDVFPTGRQSIQFEYEKSNGNYLEIEVFEDNYSAYSEINNEETEFESISLDDIFRLVNEFYSRF